MLTRTAPLQMQSQHGLSEQGSAGRSVSEWPWLQQAHPLEGATASSLIAVSPMQLKGQTVRLASIDTMSSH